MLRQDRHHQVRVRVCVVYFLLTMLALPACGPSEVQFAVKHLRDKAGDQLTDVVSYKEEPGLDNSDGAAPLQVQIRFERTYMFKIIERLNTNEISAQRVQDRIVELYKLPPNNPEETEQLAQCPVSVVVPAGKKATITVEWTERWAEGVINEGTQGEGDRLGNYSVFLGYVEPCSLIEQDNTD